MRFLSRLSPYIFAVCLAAGSVLAQESAERTAEILSPSAVLLTGPGVSMVSVATDAYSLRWTAGGQAIEIADVLPKRSNSVLLVPSRPLDQRHLYELIPADGSDPIFVRRDRWFSSLYSDKPLGAIVSEDGSETTFRLFAPRAEQVRLHLYFSAFDALDEPEAVIDLVRDESGVWETTQAGDHHGVYYTYTVHGPDEPGNYFFGTHQTHLTDPYAFVSDDSFGKARVWRLSAPPEPVAGGRPAMEDVIAYEVHVQDFTDALPVESDLKGSFPAMVKPGLTNSRGEPVGFDYLKELGINVVHLMPVQEFLHYPDDEWQAAFADDPYMIEQDIARANYQWGYRTTHALAVESRYRSNGTDVGVERRQFRDLVEAFHRDSISVIIDVVPNHTGENMDGRHYLFNFNGIDLPYYHRTDDSLRHIGPFGNEVKSEDRPMVQRWMLDQLKHFVDVFGVDGFRIDLAGQIDEQTLIWLKERLPDDLIIYGEAWIAPSDPAVANDPDLGWYKADAPITYFQDDARNAFKGPVSNPTDPRVDRGYAGGDGSVRERAMLGLTNGFPEEIDPNRGINYLDIHDNWALADRFSNTDWDGRTNVDEAGVRIAATLLFTSLGPIVIHGGTEMLRSKAVAPLEEIVKETESGSIYIHGKRDTYNLRRANRFLWENVGRTREAAGRTPDYSGMLSFWKGLIALRNSDAGSVFRIGGSAPPDGYYDWILPENDQLLGYVVDDQVLVLINTSRDEETFDGVDLGPGTWRLVSDGKRVNPAGIDNHHFLEGTHRVTVPARTAMIWVRSADGR
ncbi:MAG: pullulanase [Rhodothermales bacterium]|nr:pullulanase [Rhodothermales bacterium]